MTPLLLVQPTSEPVSLEEAKAWLRLDTSDEDALVASLISAARNVVEAATRRVLVTQTWRLTFDSWPQNIGSAPFACEQMSKAPALSIPFAPVASIVALRVYDTSSTPQVIAPSTYRLLTTPDDTRLVFTTTPTAPGRAIAGIELDIVAGYGAPTDVPQALRQAILLLSARWFENRGDTDSTEHTGWPPTVGALIAPFRRARLA